MLDVPAMHRPLGELLHRQLEQVTLVFERQLASDLSAVNRLCLHVETYRGKMLRPTLVLLSGLAAVDEDHDDELPSEQHRTLAAVTEMIHMATLVHDDVLDDADVRRGGGTVNHVWGNQSAVMLGDYLISNAFHLCSTMGDPSINLALGEVTNTLCEGELMQLHHCEDWSMDESTYFEILQRKTASLIGACCRLGAQLAGASRERMDALHRYGLSMGVAFQIRDDLLDLLGDQTIVGKTLGRDLDQGKLTLPVLYYVGSADQDQRREVLRWLEQRDAGALRNALVESGAADRAQSAAAALVDEAKACLPVLPETPARDLLDHFADTVISRRF